MDVSFLEQLQYNAFPALTTVLCDGWAVRFGGGFTYRVNCAWPVAACPDARQTAGYIEQLYKSQGMPAIFRLHEDMPHGCTAMEAELDRRGYDTQRRGNVFVCDLSGSRIEKAPDVLIDTHPSDTWLTAFLDLNDTQNAQSRDAASKMIKSIFYPTIAAYIKDGDKTIACGLGVYERGFVGLYDIFVDPSYRRKGLGNRICSAIMAQGRNLGADYAYLQVLSDNEGARTMYHNLGFRQEYEYWFRIK